MPDSPTVFLVDGSGQVHRAYFAIRGLSTRGGLPTNATYGFTSMLRKLIADEQPQFLGIVFDLPGPTFRHEMYAEYKANRPEMAAELGVQFPYVRRVCHALGCPVVEASGFEADDVIATLARQAVEAGFEVVIVSSDKDLLQLVGDRVTVVSPGREGGPATRFDAAAVQEKWGVPPERVVDVLALMGDTSDNVPGVPGIGEKGAREIISTFGSLDGALERASEVKRKSYREGLLNHRDQALLSQRLITLREDAPVKFAPDALQRREPVQAAAHALFAELEFSALAKEFAPEILPVHSELEVVETAQRLEDLVAEAKRHGHVGLAVATASNALQGGLLGLAIAHAPQRSCFVPWEGQGARVAQDAVRSSLAPLLGDPEVAKAALFGKDVCRTLGEAGLPCEGLRFDASIAAYLLDPGRRDIGLDSLVQEHLGQEVPPAIRDSPSRMAGLAADAALRIESALERRLDGQGLAPVYRELELPLVPVLAHIEVAGVRLDGDLLASMSKDMEARLAHLTTQIHELAGGEFNINSPVQLRDVLFGRLGLKSGKRTAKTRAASTAEVVLEELAQQHELPRRILEYRAIQKLKSTYVDALPSLVRPATGRIHARLHQTVAATGRLSSSDPNLQNIPIRTPEGRRIREAFVASAGCQLLSADYSQIELRVLAHLSGDPALLETFRRGEDIHDRTSREIFGPFSPLPRDQQRSFSKMINYALLYGKTAFTLARDLGVSRREAESFIAAYFERYPRVRVFIDETLAQARAEGVVRTLLGRLRRLPDINSRNTPVRQEAERQAVNTPVQGSAADLIKKAMLDLDRELALRHLSSRMILQIHDELLLEVPLEESDQVLALVKDVMEHALPLDVPLVVDARLGRTWADAH